MSKVALALPERTAEDSGASRIEAMESQLREQSEVIQSLFDAFKLLAEENVRKEKRIEKIEAINNQSKELISMHLVDGLDVIKRKIEHIDKIQQLGTDLEKLKSGLEDVRFAVAGVALPAGQATPMRDRSPSPNKRLLSTPPLPFAGGEQPTMGLKGSGSDKISQIQNSIESVLGGIEYIARQRNADVQSINSSLENLDRRIKLLAGSGSTTGSATGTPVAEPVGAQSVIGYVSSHRNFNLLMNEIRGVKDQVIPDLESEWAGKWGVLAGKIELLAGEIKRGREELHSYQEKSVVREAKLSQLLSTTENSKRFGEKSDQLAIEVSNRVLKLEADSSFVFDELKRVEDGLSQLVVLESKQDLSRSECKSNWERVARQNKQDIDALRIKVERVAVVKDEFERINADVKNLHEIFANASTAIKRAERINMMTVSAAPIPPPRAVEPLPRLLPSAGAPMAFTEPFTQFRSATDNPPPLIQATQSISTSNDSSLSMMDDGIGLPSEGIVARLSNENLIVVPIGGSETGSLRFDPSTSRVLWRIDNVASMIREPNRYSKILVSPEFMAVNTGIPDSLPLVARMKLFPQGSDQSRVHGSCSFYLRCMPGVIVRYSIDIAGEVMDTFECEYEKQRDKGKHDFVKLNEYTNPDGSVTIGIEIKAIKAKSN